jgi:tail protein
VIESLTFEGVNGSIYVVDQIMDLPLSAFEMPVESRNDEEEIVQRDGLWPEFDYLGKRTFHIEGDLIGADIPNYWQKRMQLMSCFEPRPDLGFTYTVRLHMKFMGVVEELIADCNLDGQPEIPLAAMAPAVSDCQINLKAADPRLYGLNVNAYDTGIPVVSGGMFFPMTFPLTFIAGSSGGSATIINSGNTRSYPTVQIYGQCTSPSLQTFDADGTTHSFTLDNVHIADGDFVTVDFRLRRVTSSSGFDLSGAIHAGSEWLSLNPGNNNTKFTALNAAGSCHAQWQWQNAYML